MNGTIASLMERLKAGLEAIYGPRLKGVCLFGSHARGEQDEESDVDVLIVLDRIDGYAAEIERTGGLVSETSLAHDVSVSRVFVSEAQWLNEQTTFLVNVRDEAIPA